MCVLGKGGGGWVCGCVCACVGVWVCVGGTSRAGAKKYESVSDLIGLRGWSWMFLRQFKGASCGCKSC